MTGSEELVRESVQTRSGNNNTTKNANLPVFVILWMESDWETEIFTTGGSIVYNSWFCIYVEATNSNRLE